MAALESFDQGDLIRIDRDWPSACPIDTDLNLHGGGTQLFDAPSMNLHLVGERRRTDPAGPDPDIQRVVNANRFPVVQLHLDDMEIDCFGGSDLLIPTSCARIFLNANLKIFEVTGIVQNGLRVDLGKAHAFGVVEPEMGWSWPSFQCHTPGTNSI